MLDRLMARLRPQLRGGVRVLTLTDNRQAPIGAKRQRLLEESTAEWVSFVDDDDLVSAGYVSRVLEIIDGASPPEVVGFRLRYFVDGTQAGVAVHSYEAAKYPTPNVQRGWKRFDREPNHLNPVRRSIALRVGYKSLNFGEDGDYARRLAKLKPRETFIDGYLYDYLFVPSKQYPK